MTIYHKEHSGKYSDWKKKQKKTTVENHRIEVYLSTIENDPCHRSFFIGFFALSGLQWGWSIIVTIQIQQRQEISSNFLDFLQSPKLPFWPPTHKSSTVFFVLLAAIVDIPL